MNWQYIFSDYCVYSNREKDHQPSISALPCGMLLAACAVCMLRVFICTYISIKMKVCVCVSQHHGQTAEWILMKLCWHDPWVPGKVYHP